ncbi:L,D-transpeptidase family protein [Hyphomicrobium sp. DY-1]|uniref:L,D-transpeptidase family protein n=1 Tax=Hyphomicrobium sp. DY-1 TaxID=3075650 RepID=UPI0039C45E66
MEDLISTTRFGTSVVRAAVLGAVVAFAQFVPSFVTTGHAQSLWEQLQRNYGADTSTNSAPIDRAPQRLDDLRPDSTPWRSDTMLNAISAAIEHYQQIVSAGGWPLVPPGRMMREGDDDDRVPILRKRLRITGDLSSKSTYYDSTTFDSELTDAVKHFQKRNGLRETGRIERSVYPVLNITAEQRLAELKLNYDRIKGLMQNVEERYVLVNIPAFQAEAVDKFEVQLRFRTIVGRPERETPEVAAMIRNINFYPYWHVPQSIATLDLIPRLKKEPGYLSDEGIRVYTGNGQELDPKTVDWSSPQTATYRFRQDPGAKNALGLLRLDMTNQYGVYMHDTPMKTLFDQRSRPFSAGCVRVQNVVDLADWIAHNEPGWGEPGSVRKQLALGQPMELKLTRPVPVHFVYITAWAEPSTGEVQFRQDIYGRDGSALKSGYERDDGDAPNAASAAALAP